ncbi:hypothetical protein XH98_27340 [Bradyrhizobium sp. CCBAU 51745]|uniref:DUF4435 domain-containing protein n=1 Tax=Bradyrhizobium sp. CCBAU 51745 TaxID=1325099 RepID=UPI002305BF33|nr:DUF4435 domain-containing protein [Bradyrhizobium sp. CCBAU 51745]MDA9442743.1 hypothetical protein [Bradyrhizobium sp. CCBAU 51745]
MTDVPPQRLSQEDYLEKMKTARKSPAVLKSRLVLLRGQLPNCIIFAFEGDNDKPVYYQWVKRIRPDLSYEPFVCGGKKQVFQLRDLLARDLGGLANRVYYFVDRDFDDFAGFQPNQFTFMTERYSVENYLVTAQVLDELLKDEFHCHAEPALRNQVIANFAERLDEFLTATKEINRRLFVARKLKLQLLKNLPDRINNVATVDLSKVSGAKPAEEIVVLAEEPSQADVEQLSAEFEELIPFERYRGKFSYLFFMKWLELLCLDRKEQNSICFAQIGQPRVVPIQGMTLGMLASKSDHPAGLQEFVAAVN